MKLRVCRDLVFIRPDEQPTMSEGGLHLVYDRQRSTMRGTVVALGQGPFTQKGVRLPHFVNLGDKVVFSPDSGEEMIFERETVIAMREEQILAVVEG